MLIPSLNADRLDGKHASIFTENADTSLSGNGYFLDEDTMNSDSALKVASQQSIKAYASPKITTVASDSTPNPVCGYRKNIYILTALAVNATFAVPSGTPQQGDGLLLRIKDNGTGRTLAYNAIYRNMTAEMLLLTTAGKTSFQLFIYNSTDSKWDCVYAEEEN